MEYFCFLNNCLAFSNFSQELHIENNFIDITQYDDVQQAVRFILGEIVICLQFYEKLLTIQEMEQAQFCPNKHCKIIFHFV